MDKGDRIIVRPVPADPVGELRGKYAGGATSEEFRELARDEDVERELTHPLMSVLLDAYAAMAFLRGETAAAEVEALRWRGRHYQRTNRPVSLADCVAGYSIV